MGWSYDSISPKEEKEFTIVKHGMEEEVPMREVKDYSNHCSSIIESNYINSSIKSAAKNEWSHQKIRHRRNISKFYSKNKKLNRVENYSNKKSSKVRRVRSVGTRKGKREFDYAKLLQRKNQPYIYFKCHI